MDIYRYGYIDIYIDVDIYIYRCRYIYIDVDRYRYRYKDDLSDLLFYIWPNKKMCVLSLCVYKRAFQIIP